MLQPTGKSSPKQNETNATNCRTARCNLIILTMQNKEIHTRGGQKRPHQPKVSGKFLLLDTRLLNSPDLFRLRETMGMEGWGMALFVLNYLLEHGEWGRAPLHAVTDLARMCHKNKRSMMALLTDYPTLFEIEAGGKVFNSPYLRQCLGGEKIKINQKSCGLETLTNEPSDNQTLSLHRIKDERIKKKNDEEKETTAADTADAVAKKAEKGTKQPAALGTEEVGVVARPVTSGAKQRVTSGTKEEKVVGRSVARGAKQRVTSGTKEAEVVGRPMARGAKQPAASGTEEAKMVGRSVVKGAEQRVASAAKASPATNALPHPLTEVAPLAPAKTTEESAQHAEQATASPTNSAAKAANAPEKATEGGSKHVGQVAKQPGFRLETVFTDLAQAARKLPDDERQPLRTTWEILAQLYADSLYWQSLERLVGLEVYSQERWKRLALRWFFTYCVTQAKPIAALNDAKSYLNHLLQPGRNTRQAFEHYAQTQYEADCRAWQHYRQMQGKGAENGGNTASKP